MSLISTSTSEITTELEAKFSLIQIARVRFRAFEAKFQRKPEPQDPLFFDESEDWPIKADLRTTRRQMVEAARALGIRLEPVLQFLGLEPRENAKAARRSARIVDCPTSSGSRIQMSKSRPVRSTASSSWRQCLTNDLFRSRHRITAGEVEALSKVALMGRVRNEGDLLFILKMIRTAETDL